MMFRLFRTLALWLMAVTLPLQGMAAIAMPACGPVHAAPPVASELNHHGDLNHRHVQLHAVHSADESTGQRGQANDQSIDPSGHAGHGMLKCCAVGCAMVALPMASQPARTQAGSAAPAQPQVQRYLGVYLDGLDRPPRFLLA